MTDRPRPAPLPSHADPLRPPPPPADPTAPERLATWPYLARIEFLVALAAMIVLTVWSIAIDAPLEEAADANRTPDPSKAPWYFLGLQELLVYFDPWIAGVALPLLIILGLVAIPYIDRNPAGNGYFTVRERPLAIATFLFGFLGLWIIPILIGVFCRGPGWNWYWPWQPWDVAQQPHANNVDLTDLLGLPRWSGAALVGGWYGLGLLFWIARRHTPGLRRLGGVRYALTAFLMLSMVGIPLKMALRLLFNVKYVWVTEWFNV